MTWCQTVIVDREDAIKNFTPSTSYGLGVTYNGMEGVLNEKELDEKGKEKYVQIYYEDEHKIDEIANNLPDSVKVVDVNKKKITSNPPKLYKLSTLQGEQSVHGLTADEVLNTVQGLYEKGYLSYPRTDCEFVSADEDFDTLINVAGSIIGYEDAAQTARNNKQSIFNKKEYVNDKEIQNHGHTALIPTVNKPDMATFTDEEAVIYSMIAKRFLAIFQPPLIQEQTTIISEAGEYYVKSTGKVVIQKGYTEFLGVNVSAICLNPVKIDDIYDIENVRKLEKTTTCPKRLTDGTLITLMENPAKYLIDTTIKTGIDKLTIGTPATRAAIIKKLVDDKYIERKKGCLIPTDFGSYMIHAIRGVSMCQIDTTGQWEQMFKKVRTGDISYDCAEMYFLAQLKELLQNIKGINKVYYGNAKEQRFETLMKCPGCGKDIVAGPKNYFCAGYKDGCKYSIMKNFMGAVITEADAKELFAGGIVKKELTKKDGSVKWTQALKFDEEKGGFEFVSNEDATKYNCPDCGKMLYKSDMFLSCKSCSFKVYIKFMTDKDIDDLMTKGKTKKIKNMKSKAGKKFDAVIKLTKENGKTVTKFDF